MFIMENDGTITLPRDIGSTLDPRVGTGASLFASTVPADDGCIDRNRDEDGFLTFV